MAEDGTRKRGSDDRSDDSDGSKRTRLDEDWTQTSATVDEGDDDHGNTSDLGPDVSCPICLLTLSGDMATPDTCPGHAFCPPCLRSWTGQSRLCPCDRRPFGAILIRPGVGSDTVLSREPLPPLPPPSAAQEEEQQEEMLEEQLTQQMQQAKGMVQLMKQMNQLTGQMWKTTEQKIRLILGTMAALEGAQEVDDITDDINANEALLQALVHQVVTKANAILASFQPSNSNTVEESDSQPTA